MDNISREKYHREIHDGTGFLSHRVRAVIDKYNLDMTVDSLEKTYRRWVEKMDAKEKNPVSPLHKLDNHIYDFQTMANELVPESANPLDLPPSQEANYKPFKLPINHNNILLL